MAVDVSLTKQAERRFKKLPREMRALAVTVLQRLEAEDRTLDRASMKDGSGIRVRSGDFRLIYRRTPHGITVIDMGDRRDVYD